MIRIPGAQPSEDTAKGKLNMTGPTMDVVK